MNCYNCAINITPDLVLFGKECYETLDSYFEGDKPWDLFFHDIISGQELEKIGLLNKHIRQAAIRSGRGDSELFKVLPVGPISSSLRS